MSLPQLFLALYILFALATPALVIALYVRYSKLQRQIKQLEEDSAKQTASLTRELVELKRQVAAPRAAATEQPSTPAAKPTPAPPPAPVAVKPTAPVELPPPGCPTQAC
jgi:F0F1-type ATP synthase membrane subunit b/b'